MCLKSNKKTYIYISLFNLHKMKKIKKKQETNCICRDIISNQTKLLY